MFLFVLVPVAAADQKMLHALSGCILNHVGELLCHPLRQTDGIVQQAIALYKLLMPGQLNYI
ncbi:hypothetical protein D3C76_1878870 [compost metagenome]